jgi:TIR- and PNP-associating SLOG family
MTPAPTGIPAVAPLLGRRIQIAGSASAQTDVRLVGYAQDLVRQLVLNILGAGGGIVASIGKEPRAPGAPPDSPSLIFDWTALEAAAECIRNGGLLWPATFGLPIVLVSSEKSESEIPESRRPLYDFLLASGKVRAEAIMPGSRAAVFLRDRQAQFGDALVLLGGGTGVEHSAELYLSRRRPVVPLDLVLGASREDGTGGALRLSKQARAEPGRFFRFRSAEAGTEGAALSSVATRDGNAPAGETASRVLGILAKVARPDAFYVRLLRPDHARFTAVKAFFREVVDPVVDEAGLNRIEMGTDRTEHAFMNVAIFESLHFASVVIVDVTGERPNCFIELGYGLRNTNRVLVTAEEGTKLPFDQQAIPCHFWKAGDPAPERQKAFSDFWKKYIDRPQIIKGS